MEPLNENSNSRAPCWLIFFMTLVKSGREQLFYYKERRVELYIEQSKARQQSRCFSLITITEVLSTNATCQFILVWHLTQMIKLTLANQYRKSMVDMMSGRSNKSMEVCTFWQFDFNFALQLGFPFHYTLVLCHVLYWHLLENL